MTSARGRTDNDPHSGEQPLASTAAGDYSPHALFPILFLAYDDTDFAASVLHVHMFKRAIAYNMVFVIHDKQFMLFS